MRIQHLPFCFSVKACAAMIVVSGVLSGTSPVAAQSDDAYSNYYSGAGNNGATRTRNGVAAQPASPGRAPRATVAPLSNPLYDNLSEFDVYSNKDQVITVPATSDPTQTTGQNGSGNSASGRAPQNTDRVSSSGELVTPKNIIPDIDGTAVDWYTKQTDIYYRYSQYVGRERARNYYDARQFSKDMPTVSASMQRQYIDNMGGMRALDFNGVTSGYRAINAPAPSSPEVVIAAPRPVPSFNPVQPDLNATPQFCTRNANGSLVFNGVVMPSQIVLYSNVVYFEFAKDRIQNAARTKISDVARYLQQNPNTSVLLEGHTDTVGTRARNEALAKRRTFNSRFALMKFGIDPKRICISAFGENIPSVQTGDEVRNQGNRRVEFSVFQAR